MSSARPTGASGGATASSSTSLYSQRPSSAFWKPGAQGPGHFTERDTEKESESSSFITYNPNQRLSLSEQRTRLPIYEARTAILYMVEKYQTVVIVGHTGCGKTTQVPQYLHEAGWASGGRVVACTQPRRVAATTIAQRVSEEMGVELGREVGYCIRFDNKTDPERTRVKYMTDGMLIREMMMDPLLTKYSVVMLDEAHERSLHTDILLGLLKKIQKRRADLKLIVSSATVDAEGFRDFFNTNTTTDPDQDTASIISIAGKMYPVDLHYLQEPASDYLKAALACVMEIHRSEPNGDVLVFMTGRDEIDTLVSLLHESATAPQRLGSAHGGGGRNKLDLMALPLYSGLQPAQQVKVFRQAPRNTRKVVVATNIAEASITIPGVVYVVDSCFVKIRAYNPHTGLEALLVTPESKASAKQRAGRAGRLRAGKAYRLCTEEGYNALSQNSIPEMQRTDLTQVVLQLKALGIQDVLHFDFLSPPPPESMMRALELLYALGALDDTCRLTDPLGLRLAEFPVEPRIAKMLLCSAEFGCGEEILSIAAMLSVQSLFVGLRDNRGAADKSRRRFAAQEGDHITFLNVFVAFTAAARSEKWCKQRHLNYRALTRAVDIRKQLCKYMKRFRVKVKSCDGDVLAVRKCITSAFFANAAQRQPDGKSYRTIRGNHLLEMHPTSVMYRVMPEYVIFHEVLMTSQEFMRDVMQIEAIWLHELAPHYYEYRKPIKKATTTSTPETATEATTQTSSSSTTTEPTLME